jgi:hypothetical protein
MKSNQSPPRFLAYSEGPDPELTSSFRTLIRRILRQKEPGKAAALAAQCCDGEVTKDDVSLCADELRDYFNAAGDNAAALCADTLKEVFGKDGDMLAKIARFAPVRQREAGTNQAGPIRFFH